ncbi:MAG TPA: hypothetical protein PLE33_02860 [Candidatus Cloacimonas sp.]|mgnify:FL=1|nr:hypothetical protein [Candidatus Cloacimonas sp.]HPS60185.1 hypothetical protein [Candidatus Cloacimonas sp.]
MKKKIVYVLLIIVVLGISSCDRFDHSFKPSEQVNFTAELFSPLQEAFNNATPEDLTPVMVFYADDYKHYGITKSEWETKLHTILSPLSNPVIQVSLITATLQNETNALANWRLTISDDNKTVIADSLYTGERLRKENGKWLLRGNQCGCDPSAPTQKVIVEYVTNVGCSYCPAVESVLHNLSSQLGDNFIYLTHQFSGPVAISDPLYAYYTAYSAPVSIIQGKHKLGGGTQDILDQYLPTVQRELDSLSQMDYRVISATVEGKNISGSIKLTPLSVSFNQAELVLNLAVIDLVSTAVNAEGEHLTNVVIGRKRIDISAVDLSNAVAFAFDANVTIPEDAALVVFAQKTPVTFANNATIYSGLQYPLTVKKGGSR